MLRTHSPVRALTTADRDEALEVCGRDPAANVFVAARILEGALQTLPGSVLGYHDASGLRAICWASANVVPVECDQEALEAFANRLRRHRRRCSSLFGPAEQVLPLWELLTRWWGRARGVRANQPLLAMSVRPSSLGVAPDPLVRQARCTELDLVTPAAAAMFTEEIGYPPFTGVDSAPYRASIAALITRGHTFVRVDEGRVVFKADIGSAVPGAAQIQGVWVAPDRRGQGLAVPGMAAVVETVLADVAPLATLYVNDYNAPARATYRRVGFEQVGRFATVLL